MTENHPRHSRSNALAKELSSHRKQLLCISSLSALRSAESINALFNTYTIPVFEHRSAILRRLTCCRKSLALIAQGFNLPIKTVMTLSYRQTIPLQTRYLVRTALYSFEKGLNQSISLFALNLEKFHYNTLQIL